MADENIDALREAEADLRKWWQRGKYKATDWFRRYATAALVKVLLLGIAGLGLAAWALPVAAGVVAAVAIVALGIYGIYATKLLKRQQSGLNWTWVGQRRLEQELRKAELSVDRAVLALMGEDRGMSKVRSPELRQAVAYLRHRYSAEQTARRPLQAPARRNAGPAAPDVAKVRRRVQLKEAQIAEADAVIQSYAVPENAANARAAEEAKRSRKQIQDDALAADRVARENVRHGRTASPSTPNITMQVGFSPTGARSVQHTRAPLTPEQIARGEARTAPDADANPSPG